MALVGDLFKRRDDEHRAAFAHLKLTSGLADESVRWAATVETLKVDYEAPANGLEAARADRRPFLQRRVLRLSPPPAAPASRPPDRHGQEEVGERVERSEDSSPTLTNRPGEGPCTPEARGCDRPFDGRHQRNHTSG